MAPVRPMLGDLELQQVQEIETGGEQVRTRHDVPALEGDFLQGLGRRGTEISVSGVLTGPGSREGLRRLREQFRAAEPVPFVSDVATAVKVDEVLIEDLAARELAGRPERFAYALTLREFIEPPAVEEEEPPVIPPPPPPPVDKGTLVVEVTVDGGTDFDFERVTVSIRGELADGAIEARTLTERTDNVWTEENLPPGSYTVDAITTDTPTLAAAGAGEVRAGETTEVKLDLRSAKAVSKIFVIHYRFDKAFIEPCMRRVLREVAEHARTHPQEKLLIVGHTDKAGTRTYNQSLSERRARGAFAYLTFGVSDAAAAAAEAEWNDLRQRRPAGELPSIKDTWDVWEYQYMLQDLGFYSGNIDGIHKELTDDAVRAFRCKKGLPPGTQVDDAVWKALIHDYLAKEPLQVAEGRFFRNAKDGCDGGILKWLGCGEDDALKNTDCAFRPSRRTELLFITGGVLPCEEIAEPVTLKKPPERPAATTWCLGPGNPDQRCCFVEPADPKRRDPKKDEGKLKRPAPPPRFTVSGSIVLQDPLRRTPDAPFANKKFLLTAADGTIKPGEPCRGEPQPGRTDGNGAFSFPNLPAGVYTLEVREKVVARPFENTDDPFLGNVVCQRIAQAADQLKVAVEATQLREIRLPAVVHLMTALHPQTREVRTCPHPLDASRRLPQATRHTPQRVPDLFREANRILRQARVRLEPVEVVEEAFANRPECEVTHDEIGQLLAECAYPNVVNFFFVGDLDGSTEAGAYAILPVGDARGIVDGCAVSDRFEASLAGIPDLREVDDALAAQVLAHEVGHFLGLDHVADTPANAGRLMLPGSSSTEDRRLVAQEIEQARRSCNAALECAALKLEVTGATRVGSESSHQHLVIRDPGVTVTVDAVIPAPLVEPGVGAVAMDPHDPGSPTRLTISAANTGVTLVVATYAPSPGAGFPSCLPPVVGPPGAPVPRSMRTWAVVRVVTFDLEVEGAARVGPAGSTTFVTVVGSGSVTVKAAIAPAPVCVPKNLVTWTGGAATPDPLRRNVARTAGGTFTVSAAVAGTQKSVTILVVAVRLDAVAFNHDSSSAATDALSLRKNATEFVTVPEWRAGASTVPEDSPAAYAISETQGNTITIRARFKIPAAGSLSVFVRAVAASPSVLGEVKAKQVTFQSNGETGLEAFELQNVQIGSAGVGIHDVVWKWQFRLQPTDPWVEFDTSRHRIYTVLEVPTAPWRQTPHAASNTQLPWTEVLEHACRWASGTTGRDAAAGRVTAAVYNLGPALLEYDCPNGGATHYASPSFDCTAFLERLGGGVGRGRYVNCTDCATIVSTFSNILGCDLWQSQMGFGFALNPILAIGSSVWQTACNWGGFSYHEVAWKGAATSDEEVFDACLRVDGDADPTAAPHTPLLPVNLRFGDPGDGQYRDRLASPAGRPDCEPRPSTRTRRTVT